MRKRETRGRREKNEGKNKRLNEEGSDRLKERERLRPKERKDKDWWKEERKNKTIRERRSWRQGVG